jgi:hypothetical protein
MRKIIFAFFLFTTLFLYACDQSTSGDDIIDPIIEDFQVHYTLDRVGFSYMLENQSQVDVSIVIGIYDGEQLIYELNNEDIREPSIKSLNHYYALIEVDLDYAKTYVVKVEMAYEKNGQSLTKTYNYSFDSINNPIIILGNKSFAVTRTDSGLINVYYVNYINNKMSVSLRGENEIYQSSYTYFENDNSDEKSIFGFTLEHVQVDTHNMSGDYVLNVEIIDYTEEKNDNYIEYQIPFTITDGFEFPTFSFINEVDEGNAFSFDLILESDPDNLFESIEIDERYNYPIEREEILNPEEDVLAHYNLSYRNDQFSFSVHWIVKLSNGLSYNFSYSNETKDIDFPIIQLKTYNYTSYIQVNVTVEDDNLDTIEMFFNGEEIDYTGWVSDVGNYKVIATDIHGNVTERTFTIELDQPNLLDYDKYFNTDAITLEADEDLSKCELKNENDEYAAQVNGQACSFNHLEEGVYTLEVYDALENLGVYELIVDFTNPSFTYERKYNEDLSSEILISGQDIYLKEVNIYDEDGIPVENPVTKTGAYEIIVTDLSGNQYSEVVSFDMNRPVHDLPEIIFENNYEVQFDQEIVGYSIDGGRNFVEVDHALSLTLSDLEEGMHDFVIIDTDGNYSERYRFNVETKETVLSTDTFNKFDVNNITNPYDEDVLFAQSMSVNDSYIVISSINQDQDGLVEDGFVDVYSAVDYRHIRTIYPRNIFNDTMFGYSVEVLGEILYIGALSDNNKGSVYVYDLSLGDFIDKITPSDDSIEFGQLIEASEDYLAIKDGNNKIYVYGQEDKQLLIILDEDIDSFGQDIIFNGDYMMISASEKVYLYDLSTLTLSRVFDNPEEDPGFGYEIAFKDDHIVIGRFHPYRKTTNGFYIYKLSDETYELHISDIDILEMPYLLGSQLEWYGSELVALGGGDDDYWVFAFDSLNDFELSKQFYRPLQNDNSEDINQLDVTNKTLLLYAKDNFQPVHLFSAFEMEDKEVFVIEEDNILNINYYVDGELKDYHPNIENGSYELFVKDYSGKTSSLIIERQDQEIITDQLIIDSDSPLISIEANAQISAYSLDMGNTWVQMETSNLVEFQVDQGIYAVLLKDNFGNQSKPLIVRYETEHDIETYKIDQVDIRMEAVGSDYTYNYNDNINVHGDFIIVTSEYEKINGVSNGAVHVFKFSDPSYHRIISNDFNGQTKSSFGVSVDVYQNYLIVGAPGANGSNGGVYIYHLLIEDYYKEIVLDTPTYGLGAKVGMNDKYIVLMDNNYMTYFIDSDTYTIVDRTWLNDYRQIYLYDLIVNDDYIISSYYESGSSKVIILDGQTLEQIKTLEQGEHDSSSFGRRLAIKDDLLVIHGSYSEFYVYDIEVDTLNKLDFMDSSGVYAATFFYFVTDDYIYQKAHSEVLKISRETLEIVDRIDLGTGGRNGFYSGIIITETHMVLGISTSQHYPNNTIEIWTLNEGLTYQNYSLDSKIILVRRDGETIDLKDAYYEEGYYELIFDDGQIEDFVIDYTHPIIHMNQEVSSNSTVLISANEDMSAYRLNEGQWINISSDNEMVLTLEDGVYTIETKDMSGNESNMLSFIIDTLPPVIEEVLVQDQDTIYKTDNGLRSILNYGINAYLYGDYIVSEAFNLSYKEYPDYIIVNRISDPNYEQIITAGEYPMNIVYHHEYIFVNNRYSKIKVYNLLKEAYEEDIIVPLEENQRILNLKAHDDYIFAYLSAGDESPKIYIRSIENDSYIKIISNVSNNLIAAYGQYLIYQNDSLDLIYYNHISDTIIHQFEVSDTPVDLEINDRYFVYRIGSDIFVVDRDNLEQKVIDITQYPSYGSSIKLQLEGDYLFVNCPSADYIEENSGIVYIYDLLSTSAPRILSQPDQIQGSWFGNHVQVLGNSIYIGAYLYDELIAQGGIVYEYKFDDSDYINSFIPEHLMGGQQFGGSFDFSDYANIIAMIGDRYYHPNGTIQIDIHQTYYTVNISDANIDKIEVYEDGLLIDSDLVFYDNNIYRILVTDKAGNTDELIIDLS